MVQPPKIETRSLALRLFFRLSRRLNIFGNCMIFLTIFAKGWVTGRSFIYTGASVSEDSLAFNQKVQSNVERSGRSDVDGGAFKHCHFFQGGTKCT